MTRRKKMSLRVSYPDQSEWKKENEPFGQALGYPQCCIDEFCLQSPRFLKANKAQPKDFVRYQAAHLNGKYTGFLPCYKHAVQVLNGSIKLQDLIQPTRKPEFFPFPLAFPIEQIE